MKFILKTTLKILMLITLLSIQICLLKYEHTPNFNLLLIFYNYIFFNHISTFTAAILLLMMDGISFLMTGYFGFIIIFMTIFSMLALKYDNLFYNKLVMPIVSIALFNFIQNFILFYILNYQHSIQDFFIATLLNSSVLILLWIITKRPIHT